MQQNLYGRSLAEIQEILGPLTDKPFQPQSISDRFELEFTFIGKICEEKDCSHLLVLDCLSLGRITWVFKPEKKPTQ